MVLKFRVTRKSLAKLTPDKLVSRIALEQGGAEANAAIGRRVTGPNTDADGRKLAEKRVKQYRQREPWVKAKEVRIIAEVRTPTREKIGRVKEAREDLRYGGAAGFTGSSVPPVIFQQMRRLGGVFRSIDAYEAEKLKGGTPIECQREQSWRGRYWSQGDVWGFHWPNRAAFLADQGKGERVTLGGAGSRIWSAATAKAAIRSGGRAILTLGFRGRRPRGDATQMLRDMGGTTAKGKPRKPSAAEIAAVANSRTPSGQVGYPASTDGQPTGGVAPLSRRVPDSLVQRWHALSPEELRRTVLSAMDRGALKAIREAPVSVVLIEKGQRRKVK